MHSILLIFMQRPCCALMFLHAGKRFLLWFHFAPTWALIFVSALLIRGPCLVTRRIGAVSWLISSVANVNFSPLCLLWVTSVFLLFRGFFCDIVSRWPPKVLRPPPITPWGRAPGLRLLASTGRALGSGDLLHPVAIGGAGAPLRPCDK